MNIFALFLVIRTRLPMTHPVPHPPSYAGPQFRQTPLQGKPTVRQRRTDFPINNEERQSWVTAVRAVFAAYAWQS
jgi:hypothetical protein